MKRLLVCLALLAVPLALAAGPPSPADETYEIALLDGARVGFCHTRVTRQEDARLRVTSSLDLTLRRFNAVVKLRMDHGTVETAEGKVDGVFMNQLHGAGKRLALTGEVIDDDKLFVKVDDGRIERRVRWSTAVLGQRQQEALFAAKKVAAGDSLTFERFEPIYNSVVTVRAEVKPAEEVESLGVRKKLLRVELTPEELKGANVTIKPPKAVWWLNDSLAVVRKQSELDGIGTLTLIRATKELALAAATGPSADVGRRSLVPLNRLINRPYDLTSLSYRVTVRGEDKPSRLFARDDHQSAQNEEGATFELRVHPVRPGEDGVDKASEEHLGTSHYIDHDDARVKELASRAIVNERDAWRKAQRIERFVKNHIRTDNAAELVPASRTAKELRGDCRHHAFLTAAMCRAAGLPARTAIGLLYVNRGGPYLGFHMWVEVLIEGRWVGIDSTLGKGGVSATHVKVTQHSWHETQSLTPLLPVSRVTGKLKVEVMKD